MSKPIDFRTSENRVQISTPDSDAGRLGAKSCDFCHVKPRKRKHKINKGGFNSLMFCSSKCLCAYKDKYGISN